jgi:HAD superfamily phosphoserine phosphatase-like hydrolase
MLTYQLGWVRGERAVARAIAHLAGTSADDVKERTRVFWEHEVRGRYRPGALRALAEHRQLGDHLALLTSSSFYLSHLVAEELGFDAVLSNRFEVDAAGRHTGRSEGAVCFGAGKLAHAAGLASQLGVALSACVFYTDSFSDLPVLERVGRPVAVNPDGRLRRRAVQRGWEVVDWGRELPPRRDEPPASAMME